MLSSNLETNNFQTLFLFNPPTINSNENHYSNSLPTSTLHGNANLDENNQDNTTNKNDAYWKNETLNNDQLTHS